MLQFIKNFLLVKENILEEMFKIHVTLEYK